MAVEVSGRWLLVVRTMSIKGRQRAEGNEVIRQGQSDERLPGLKRGGQRLTVALGDGKKAAVAG